MSSNMTQLEWMRNLRKKAPVRFKLLMAYYLFLGLVTLGLLTFTLMIAIAFTQAVALEKGPIVWLLPAGVSLGVALVVFVASRKQDKFFLLKAILLVLGMMLGVGVMELLFG